MVCDFIFFYFSEARKKTQRLGLLERSRFSFSFRCIIVVQPMKTGYLRWVCSLRVHNPIFTFVTRQMLIQETYSQRILHYNIGI